VLCSLLRPLDGAFYYMSGARSSGKEAQSLTDNGHLRLGVTRRPKGRAVWEVHVQGPRNADILGDIPVHDNTDGRDALGFDSTSDQSHGLLADRSTGRQERCLHSVCSQSSRHLRRGLVDQLERFRQVAHEAVRPRVQAPNDAFLHQLLEMGSG